MKWFAARLIFQIRTGAEIHANQFDESVRIFQASDLKHAILKARHAGVADETSFTNIHGELVLWKFIDVNMVNEISTLGDGQEVFSNTIQEEQPSRYMQSVKRHAQLLLPDLTPEIILEIE